MTNYEQHTDYTLDVQLQSQNSRMKTKYAMVFICIVALVIIEKESNILSRVSDKLIQRQAPQPPLDYSNITQNGSPSLSEEQEEEELDDLGTYSFSGGRKHILLLATTRTGSSFVGELFNQHGEDMFYLFEPLWHVDHMLTTATKSNNGTVLSGIYRDVLQGLFLCDFSLLEKYIAPPPKDHVTPAFSRRESSLSLCEESVCSPVVKNVSERFPCKTRRCGPLNLTLATDSCLSKQHHAVKTVRVRQLDTFAAFSGGSPSGR
ncbi:hypothetical protein KUCAC02_012340 [Chaenocephalus aceratus]|uniref:Uncharacterized protein n=1 Tax=Chaenocephalus aceratus TaxID=36190 RepID=A0ACB9XCE4_CHAAC|nr:hypothetical protein KUCAC02_012340 [Chaenocephalus aceratus]